MKSFNRQNTQDVKRAKKQSKQLRNLKKMKLQNDAIEDNAQQVIDSIYSKGLYKVSASTL